LLEGRDKDQPLRNSIVWTRGSAVMGLADDWAPAQERSEKQKSVVPNAVLLDEKWYALELHNANRIFDIAADPGMVHDVSAAHPELQARALEVFRELDAAQTAPLQVIRKP
jgi:hypothetical protein